MTGTKVKLETAADYYKQMVVPDSEHFARNPTDLRCAIHLAGSLFHLRDWVFTEHGPEKGWHDLGAIQDFLQSKCAYFGLIRDIANSGKHMRLTNPSKPATGVTGAADTLATLTPDSIMTRVGGDDEYLEGSGSAIVVAAGGRALRFDRVAGAVLKMWRDLFVAEGWLAAPKTASSSSAA